MIFNRDEAMTKWWLKLTVAGATLGFVSTYIQPIFCFVKGVCAASSCCIFVGYYTFVVIYNNQNEPHLSRQLYIAQELESLMPFSTYVVLDTFVHMFIPIFTFYHWHVHITITGTIVAYLFHRYWSLLNSDFTTPYLVGDKIYNVKEVKWWGWPTIYAGEASMLVLGTILAFYLHG